MKILSILLVVALIAFAGYQIVGLVRDIRKKKRREQAKTDNIYESKE